MPEVPFLGGSVGRSQAPTRRRQTGEMGAIGDQQEQEEPQALRARREAEERVRNWLRMNRRNQSQSPSNSMRLNDSIVPLNEPRMRSSLRNSST